jgi:hypothetical protein
VTPNEHGGCHGGIGTKKQLQAINVSSIETFHRATSTEAEKLLVAKRKAFCSGGAGGA